MRLDEYVRAMGVEKFARLYGVTLRAAVSYRDRTRRPKAEVAQRIVERSPVTWEGIYAPWTKVKRQKKRIRTRPVEVRAAL